MALEGSLCLVTGGSSGIGRALAVSLADAGAHVLAVGRSIERLTSLAEGVEKGSVTPLVADLTHDDEVEAMADLVLARGQRLDVLAHAAGAISLGTLESSSVSDLDEQYAINLRAPFVVTKALLPALRKARGQVVFLNSSAAIRASANNVLYAATKAGLRALADGLRDEVNAEGVRVVTLYIGRTDTPMQISVHEFEGRPYRAEVLLRPDDVVGAILGALTLPATGELTELSIRPSSKLLEPR